MGRRTGRILSVLAVPFVVGAVLIPAIAAGHPAQARVQKATPSPTSTAAVANTAAQTPPMGFDAWFQNGCNVTQQDILSNAQSLVSTGLAADGYNYVILDDCWMAKTRSASGALRPRKAAFPNGIAWLARHVHALGLKLGIYESAGTRTCRGYPGSYLHYQQDAQTFASWGVDYVKLDSCGMPAGVSQGPLFREFGAYLAADNPAITYSEELPVHAATDPVSARFKQLVAMSSQFANLWRVTPDEKDTLPAPTVLTKALTADLPLAQYASAGHWNDLDLLVTGNTVFNWTTLQQQAQLSIWAEMSSPLIVSADLANQAAVAHLASRAGTTGSLLANKKVIAVDQDPVQGKQAGSYGLMKVVVKPMPTSGAYAVLAVNTAPTMRTVTVPLSVMGIPSGDTWTALWGNKVTRGVSKPVTFALHGGGTLLYEVTP